MENQNKSPSPRKGFSANKLSNSGSRESNENYCSGKKMQTPKKVMSKHFMSPTISAASKVAVPRKKILGERNGIPPFLDTPSQKSPNCVPKTDLSGHYSPKIISPNGFGSETRDDERTPKSAYDPSSCYLSARPKYLRYNPDRRRDFILQLESEGREERDGFGDEECDFQNVLHEEISSVDDEVSPSEGGSDSLDSEKGTSLGVVKKHEAEVEENGEDEVVEEFQDNAARSEKAASHVVVEEPNYEDEVELNNEEVQEEFEEETEQYEDVKGWSWKGIMKFLAVVSILILATSFIVSMDSNVMDSEEDTANTKYLYNRNQEHTSKNNELYMLKDGYEIYMGVVNLDFEEVKLVEDSEEGMMESGLHEQVEIVDSPVEWDDVPAMEDERLEQFSDQLNVATNAVSANFIHGGEMETEVEWKEHQPLEDEWHKLSNQLIGDANSGSANSINGGEIETEVEWNLDVLPLEDECHQFPDQQVEADKSESSDHRDELELLGRKEQMGLVEYSGPLYKDDMVESKDMLEDATVETMAASETRLLQLKNKATAIGIIGAFLSMTLGSLFFISRSKGQKVSEEPALVVANITPIETPVLTEEHCPGTPKVEEKKIEKLAEPRAATSLLDFSRQAAKEFSQISTPTVHLLGELVVGEVERSLRRCDRDQKRHELIESEYSYIQETKKAVSNISSSAIAPALEFSTADSASCYGSYTTEAKILKIENGRAAEVTTPVRRSGRIRSRFVTSYS